MAVCPNENARKESTQTPDRFLVMKSSPLTCSENTIARFTFVGVPKIGTRRRSLLHSCAFFEFSLTEIRALLIIIIFFHFRQPTALVETTFFLQP